MGSLGCHVGITFFGGHGNTFCRDKAVFLEVQTCMKSGWHDLLKTITSAKTELYVFVLTSRNSCCLQMLVATHEQRKNTVHFNTKKKKSFTCFVNKVDHLCQLWQ